MSDGTNDPSYEPGTVVRLKGKTQRGRNRVNRGGELFEVAEYSDGYGHFLRSVDKGNRECFWAWLPNDANVEVLARAALTSPEADQQCPTHGDQRSSKCPTCVDLVERPGGERDRNPIGGRAALTSPEAR